MRYQFEVANSLAATVAEAGRGVRIRGAQRQPEELLELYDMENCPFCRVVRQTLTELDLDAMIYPCPKGGVRYRPLVKQLGGREMFPYLYDPNTDTGLYESADIIAYLYETYSNLPAPGYWKVKAMMTAPSIAASVLRRGNGLRSEHVQDPGNPLELYSFETSPIHVWCASACVSWRFRTSCVTVAATSRWNGWHCRHCASAWRRITARCSATARR